MKLDEISSLIAIETYLEKAINNPAFPKEQFKQMIKIKVLINQKLANLILSDEFKTYIDYENADQVMKEVALRTNISTRFK